MIRSFDTIFLISIKELHISLKSLFISYYSKIKEEKHRLVSYSLPLEESSWFDHALEGLDNIVQTLSFSEFIKPSSFIHSFIPNYFYYLLLYFCVLDNNNDSVGVPYMLRLNKPYIRLVRISLWILCSRKRRRQSLRSKKKKVRQGISRVNQETD